MKKRQFSGEYKAKTVLEVLREEKTLSEICAREGLAVPMVSGWKREFLDNAGSVFASRKQDKYIKEQIADSKTKEKDLMAKVGQLTLEVDYLKKKYEQVYGHDWAAILGLKF